MRYLNFWNDTKVVIFGLIKYSINKSTFEENEHKELEQKRFLFFKETQL